MEVLAPSQKTEGVQCGPFPQPLLFCKILFQIQESLYLFAYSAGCPSQCCDCLIHRGISMCWQGMEDMAHRTASLVPCNPGLRGPGDHLVCLTQDMLPLGTPCIVQKSESEPPITLKSSGILCITQFIMPQHPKSLVSSGYFFFLLWGLRDYCESSP